MRDKAQPIDYLMLAASVQDKDIPRYLTRGKKYPVLRTLVEGGYVIADDDRDKIRVGPAYDGHLPAGSWGVFYADEAGFIPRTPCERYGYEEGDAFVLKAVSKDGRPQEGDLLILSEDDGTDMPLFRFKNDPSTPQHTHLDLVEKVEPAEQPELRQLAAAAMRFLELSEFKVGALAEWKPGFRNKMPEGPFIIMDVGLMDCDKEPTCDSVYYSEPLDVCVGYLDRPEDSQGVATFLLMLADSRRLQPVDDDA